MKLQKYFLSLFALVFFVALNVFAQEEMTEDEWQNEMNRLTEKKTALTKKVNALQTEVNDLRQSLADMQTYEDCMQDLYTMVGANATDVAAFRKQVNALNGRIDRKEEPKEDRQAELDALKDNKMSALPEFFDKVHNQMQRKLDAWVVQPKEVLYSVVKGDCLWNIAKKKEHYDNAFAWPKIYNANRDQIKNPDLIYPKQIFKIPNLTDEEKAKYDKIKRNYKPAPPTQN